MLSAKFSIRLNERVIATTRSNDRTNFPVMRFDPGAQIHGDVTCTFSKEVELKHLPVTLKWRIWEEGKVREEIKAQAVDALTSGNSATKTHSGNFTLQAPREPWSYQGTLFHIQWVIQIDTGKLTSMFFGSDLRQLMLIEIMPLVPANS